MNNFVVYLSITKTYQLAFFCAVRRHEMCWQLRQQRERDAGHAVPLPQLCAPPRVLEPRVLCTRQQCVSASVCATQNAQGDAQRTCVTNTDAELAAQSPDAL